MKVNNPNIPKVFRGDYGYYIKIKKDDINHIISGFIVEQFDRNYVIFTSDEFISDYDIGKYFNNLGENTRSSYCQKLYRIHKDKMNIINE